MGIYYDASLVWGLHIPDVEPYDDLHDVYDLPSGLAYSMGGDFMGGENITYVLHPQGAAAVIMDSSFSGFGVTPVEDIYTPTDEDYQALSRFADDNNLEPKIGWFGVSSVG